MSGDFFCRDTDPMNDPPFLGPRGPFWGYYRSTGEILAGGWPWLDIALVVSVRPPPRPRNWSVSVIAASDFLRFFEACRAYTERVALRWVPPEGGRPLKGRAALRAILERMAARCGADEPYWVETRKNDRHGEHARQVRRGYWPFFVPAGFQRRELEGAPPRLRACYTPPPLDYEPQPLDYYTQRPFPPILQGRRSRKRARIY